LTAGESGRCTPRPLELAPSQGVRWIDAALVAYARGFEHPAKIRILRWLVRRLVAGRLRVRYGAGATIAIDPADYIGWAVLRTGHYEPASLALALQIMARQPGLFVDIGANFGWYSCAAAAIAGATVISIEPDCENCAALRANLVFNQSSNVTVINGAVGANFAAVQMIRRARSNSGTVAIKASDEAPGIPGDWVATMPLDLLLERIVVPPVRPVLIKLDVEGFEPQALAGLDFAGPFRPHNILMEFDPVLSAGAWGSLSAVQAFFTARGYLLFDVFGRPLSEDQPVPEANIWARDRSADPFAPC
jgi:FkbM family methyltransferase